MPFKSQIDAGAGLIIHIATGTLVVEEMISAFDEAASDPHFRPDMNVLWDLADAELQGGSADDIRALAAAIGQRMERGEFHKVGIAAPQDLAYGLARMYEAYAGQLPIELRVFRSSDEALDWLRGDSPA